MGAKIRSPDATLNLIWQPHPGPQTALLECQCFEVFYGGARGGGKTDGVLGEFASHADLYAGNASGLMVRRTRTELVDTIERSKRIYGPLGSKFNESDKLWRFPNGARLRFAYLERDSDADAYQGHSYTRVYVEEAGTFPSPKPIFKLMATLRSGSGVPVGIRLTGNPGGPGQQWVKSRYIDPEPSGWKIHRREFTNPFTQDTVTKDWVYIPSRVYDNPSLNPSEYIANLQMSGGPQLVKAWLEGDFGAIEGAFFDCWSYDKHVCRPFLIPDTWHRFRSMDWGSASPFSVGWWAVVGDSTSVPTGLPDGSVRTIPRGCLVRYREWYGCDRQGAGLKLTAEQVAHGILEREAPTEHKLLGVLDPSAFSVDGGPSIAERMGSAGVLWRPADNKRVARPGEGKQALSGWDQMRARMVDGMIICFDTCKDSIRTIPTLQHDPDHIEDVDTEAEDHAADEWRYACMSRPYIKHIPIPKIKKADDYRFLSKEVRAGDWRSY